MKLDLPKARFWIARRLLKLSCAFVPSERKDSLVNKYQVLLLQLEVEPVVSKVEAK